MNVANQDFVVCQTDKKRGAVLVEAEIDDGGLKLVLNCRRGDKSFVVFGSIQRKNFQEVLAFIFHLVHLGNCKSGTASDFHGLVVGV